MAEQQVDFESVLTSCYVQVLGAQARHVGGGVLVDDRHVVTCAHVVALALHGVSKTQGNSPTETVLVTTPIEPDAVAMEATVQVWGPGHADSGEKDLAVLRLKEAAPSSMRARPFALAGSLNTHGFATWGITENYPEGRDLTGTIRMGRTRGRVRLEGDADRPWPSTIGGFSGGAVWDRNRGGIVGVLASEGETREAYLIPTQVLRQLWIDLPLELPERSPTLTYVEDLAMFISEPGGTWSARDPSFDVQCHLGGSLYSSNQAIARIVRDNSTLVLIKDRSGAGKSVFIGGIVRSLLDPTSEYLPILCDLQTWDAEDSAKLAERAQYFSETEPSKIDVILSRSIVSVDSLSVLRVICGERRPVILIDALDAVGRRGQRKEVLGVLYEFKARAGALRFLPPLVIIADRSIENAPRHWLRTQLTEVSPDRCRELIDSAFGSGAFAGLPRANQTLLQHPLILDVALTAKSPELVSITDGIRKLFVDRLGLETNQISILAEATFLCHSRGAEAAAAIGTSVIDKVTFDKHIEQQLTNIGQVLVEEGVLVDLSDRHIKFYHQRIHDYLTATHLAASKERVQLWNRSTFDRVTFDSSDPGVLAMTLELLGSPEEGDGLLERIYDWNWNAAMHAAIQVSILPEPKCTTEMLAALFAMIKEKTLDDVLASRTRAASLLDSVSAGAFQSILDAQNLDQLREAVEGFPTGTAEWYQSWRRVFLSRWDHEQPSEEDILLVADPHSLVGWCAANVLRRGTELSSELQMAVRALYTAVLAAATPESEVIRWRAIHVLGICPRRENARLMLSALDDDPYYWVKYGAARALVEIASRSMDSDFTQHVLQEVQNRCPALDAKIQLEIGRCALTRAGTETWGETIRPLINFLVDLNQSGPNNAEWEHLKSEFASNEWTCRRER